MLLVHHVKEPSTVPFSYVLVFFTVKGYRVRSPLLPDITSLYRLYCDVSLQVVFGVTGTGLLLLALEVVLSP